MRSSFEILRYVKNNSEDFLGLSNEFLHGNPYEVILEDLEDFKFTNDILRCKTLEDFCKLLKTRHNIIDGKVYSSSDLIETAKTSFRHQLNPKTYPIKYGLRAKLYELIFFKDDRKDIKKMFQ